MCEPCPICGRGQDVGGCLDPQQCEEDIKADNEAFIQELLETEKHAQEFIGQQHKMEAEDNGDEAETGGGHQQ